MTEDCEQLAQPYQESIHETVAEEEDVLHALPPGPSHHRNASGHKRRPSMGGKQAWPLQLLFSDVQEAFDWPSWISFCIVNHFAMAICFQDLDLQWQQCPRAK